MASVIILYDINTVMHT